MTIVRDIIDAHSYFSVWSLYFMMMIVWSECTDPMMHSRCLFFLVISCCGGSHVTYIYPKRLYVRYLRYEFRGLSLMMMDVLGHYMPLFYYLYNYFIPSSAKLSHILSVDHTLVPTLYIILGRYHELYRLRWSDMMSIGIMSILCTYYIQVLFSSVGGLLLLEYLIPEQTTAYQR